MLISGTGELVKVDIPGGTYKVVTAVPGFARGMDLLEDYLFIGLSKLRTGSKDFQNLPVSAKSVVSGVTIVHLPTGTIAGSRMYQSSVEEIFDVKVLPGIKRPGILNESKGIHQISMVAPKDAFWIDPAEDESNHAKN